MKRARTARRRSMVATPPTADADASRATLVVPVAARRNPFVVHAHRRHAGAHGGGARKRRQAEKRELKKLLEE